MTEAEVKAFFFKSMIHSLKGTDVLEKTTLAPGWEFYNVYQKGSLLFKTTVMECPHTDVSRFISDRVIYYDEKPIWIMRREGWFLTRLNEAMRIVYGHARMENYKESIFLAAGGPESFEWEGFTYKNSSKENLFTQFEGEELIVRRDDVLAWQRTWGQAWELLA